MTAWQTEKGVGLIREAQGVFDACLLHLRQRRQTLGFAESCTGGLLSAMAASFAGVSDVYMGSVVAYANSVKHDFLSVDKSSIAASGAVSFPIAKQMAQGIRRAIGCSWGVAITGIAGPGGGSSEKPVGTVWIAVSGPGAERVEKFQFDGDRTEIQAASVLQAARMLLTALK